jgi:hypothetical protein
MPLQLRYALIIALVSACGSRSLHVTDDGDPVHAADLGPVGIDSGTPTVAPTTSLLCQTDANCPERDSYCAFEGYCAVGTDLFGECRDRPQECTDHLEPVCGCDGRTYSNPCDAGAHGMNIAHQGHCEAVIQVTTSKKSYQPDEAIVITVRNAGHSTVFLRGCSVLRLERYQEGIWVNKGGTVDCDWEGYSRELHAGASTDPESVFLKPGKWRARVLFGLGCTTDKPLGEENCAAIEEAVSESFQVLPSPDACASIRKSFLAALTDAKMCDYLVNHPQCTILKWTDMQCCGTFVNDDTALLPLEHEYSDSLCTLIKPTFLCEPCDPPLYGHCKGDGSEVDTCVDDG